MLPKLNLLLVLALTLVITLWPGNIYAHCDSVNGPVIKAAKQSLETGNVNYILIWVKPEDEKEISSLFNKVVKVRNINDDVKELADNYLFETLVRIHRQGEGVAYTGIKTAEYKPEEGIEAADLAIESNSVGSITKHVNESYHHKISELFNELRSKKEYDINDTTKGREYVASYVHFIHYIEGIYSGKQSHEHQH